MIDTSHELVIGKAVAPLRFLCRVGHKARRRLLLLHLKLLVLNRSHCRIKSLHGLSLRRLWSKSCKLLLRLLRLSIWSRDSLNVSKAADMDILWAYGYMFETERVFSVEFELDALGKVRVVTLHLCSRSSRSWVCAAHLILRPQGGPILVKLCLRVGQSVLLRWHSSIFFLLKITMNNICIWNITLNQNS